METLNSIFTLTLFPILLIILLHSQPSSSSTNSSTTNQLTQTNFLKCLQLSLPSPTQFSTSCFTPTNTSFSTVLNSTANNLRCLLPTVPKPELIYVPTDESHVQAAVVCAARLNIQLRLRSGGHDYEGVSYSSELGELFVVVDMSKLRAISVDISAGTAWVEAGATVGELYYRVAQQSPTRGFPAGLCNSLGVGGHITGGAYGSMMRKYGLGVDNVVDARLVGPDGKILDRKSMGEDLFWAIRGGGGGSFGILLAWKVKLVKVPQKVTTFTVVKTLDDGLTKLLSTWQNVAYKFDENLFIRVEIMPGTKPNSTEKTVQALFNSLYLGPANALMRVMGRSFPELGLALSDCAEMSWIESVVSIAGWPAGTSTDILLQGKPTFRNYFKAKSDYVRTPIPESALEGLWTKLMETDSYIMIWNPYGGKMAEIPEDATPFPHRKGVLYKIQYVSTWQDGVASEGKNMAWIRDLYNYMEPYVSNSPREAYVNYRDLDLGTNKDNDFNVGEAVTWGTKYFKNNFERLVKIKTKFDPQNFFRHEQSIPPLSVATKKGSGRHYHKKCRKTHHKKHGC